MYRIFCGGTPATAPGRMLFNTGAGEGEPQRRAPQPRARRLGVWPSCPRPLPAQQQRWPQTRWLRGTLSPSRAASSAATTISPARNGSRAGGQRHAYCTAAAGWRRLSAAATMARVATAVQARGRGFRARRQGSGGLSCLTFDGAKAHLLLAPATGRTGTHIRAGAGGPLTLQHMLTDPSRECACAPLAPAAAQACPRTRWRSGQCARAATCGARRGGAWTTAKLSCKLGSKLGMGQRVGMRQRVADSLAVGAREGLAASSTGTACNWGI